MSLSHCANLFLLDSRLDGSKQRLRVGADNLVDLLAVLEDEEGGHGADSELLGYVGDLIDVELDKVCASVLLREPVCLLVFVMDWREELTWRLEGR